MTDRCDEVEPLWSAWLDGMLGGRDQARVEAHLRSCPACEEDVEDLGRVRDLLRNLPMRRLPDDLALLPEPGPAPPRHAIRPHWSAGQRAAAGLAVAVGLVGGAAFALGGQPSPGERIVTVPVDLYVADHLLHTVGGPLSTPVVVDGRP